MLLTDFSSIHTIRWQCNKRLIASIVLRFVIYTRNAYKNQLKNECHRKNN